MKTPRQEAIPTACVLFLGLTLMVGCSSGNRTLDFLENAEFQAEDPTQEQKVAAALDDALTLPAEELEARRYPDYSGKEDQWDLRTLIERHFVPDAQGKTLGEDFYAEIKSSEGQKMVRELLEGLRQAGPD